MHFWIRVCIGMPLLCSSVVFAAEPQASITLNEAVARVLEHNPRLQAADFDNRAAAARVRQQAQSTPFELGVELENFAGSGVAAGADGLESTLSLSRVLEPRERLQRRSEVARLEAGLLRHEQDAQRLDLMAETARRFLALARAQAQRALAVQRVTLMQRTLESVEQRFRVAKATAGERSRVQIELARAELAVEETDHLLDTGRRRLAVMWGRFDADFTGVRAALLKLEAEPEFAELDQMIERNPVIARLATTERLGAARSLLARSRARADVDVRAGLRHLNETDDIGLVLALRVPLGSGGRSQAYVQEAEALAAREPLLAQDRRLELRATLSALHQELLHARDRFETYTSRIIPAAEAALSHYSEGYDAGRYSLLELSAVQETLLEAHREVLSAAVEHHTARIEIDRLVGVAPVNGVFP